MTDKTRKKLSEFASGYTEVCGQKREAFADSLEKIRSLRTDLKTKPDLKFHPVQKAVHGITNELHGWGFRHQVVSYFMSVSAKKGKKMV